MTRMSSGPALSTKYEGRELVSNTVFGSGSAYGALLMLPSGDE